MRFLIGSRAKISRANEQIETLRNKLHAITDPNGNPLLVDFKEDFYDGHPARTIFVTKVPIFPPEISILIGEIVHNLRSSLDNLAWALVPPGQVKAMNVRSRRQIAFPFAESRKNFWRRISQRIPITDATQHTFIEQYQPYRRSSTGRIMRALRILSDTDKHRFIVPTLFVPGEFDVEIKVVGAQRLNSFIRLAPGREIKLGTELNTFTFTANPQEVSMKYTLTCFYAFSRSLLRPSTPTNDFESPRGILLEIAATCAEILDHFEV